MALDLIQYHKKRVLIIEDLAEMRSSMKSMLSVLGVQKTDTVVNGEEALHKVTYNSYDIIFSDYELGRGKDGQQILEEIRHSELIPATTVYIMVTAAQTVEMVMGALEHEPDGYIAKPVTLDILRTRLNRIIRTKEVYREINTAIDKKDINKAMEACNRLALEKPKFALPAYRIKGKLLIAENRLEEAQELYDTVLGIKKVAWAILGMGKVQYLQGNQKEAQKLLEGLSNTRSRYVEAYDWLAKVLEAQGKFKAAQSILEQAVIESPKSIVRQQDLSRLAELNGDFETTHKACRKAYALSKNSVLKNADGQIRYAKSLQFKIKYGSSRDQKLALNEAQVVLQSIKTDFELTLEQLIRCGLIEAQTLYNSDNKEAGRLAYNAVLAMIDEKAKLTMDDKLDMFLVKLLYEEEPVAKQYGDNLLKEINGNRRLQTKYYRVLDLHLSNDPAQRMAMLYSRGQELMEILDYEEAYDVLSKACRLPSADENCQLEALKAVIALYKQGAQSTEHLTQATALFDALKDMDSGDPRYPTLEKLRLQWAEQQEDEQQSASG